MLYIACHRLNPTVGTTKQLTNHSQPIITMQPRPTTIARRAFAPSVAINAQAPAEKSDTARVDVKESTYKAIAQRVYEYACGQEISHLDGEEFNNGDRLVFIDGEVYANQHHEIEEEVGYSGIRITSLSYDLKCTTFDLEGEDYAANDFDQTRLEKYL